MATPDQIRTRGRWSLVLGTLIAALLLSAVAYADNFQNDVEAGGNDTITAGGSTTIMYRLVANSSPQGDIGGCNVDASNKATVMVTSPAGVVANPSSFQFEACGSGGAKSVTFSSSTAGSHSITHAISGGKPGALYNNQANWTLTVNAGANEDPTADAGGPYAGEEGASIALDGSGSTDDGAIMSYAWSVTPQSGGSGDPDSGASCTFVDGTSSTDSQPKVSCTDDRTYDVSLTVTDDDGATDGDSTTLTLSNVDPTATPNIPASSVDEGSSFVLALSSPTDQGANDTFTYRFDCGDGSGYGAATTTASETCGTNDDGPRSVKLKILDDDGGFTEYTGTVTVVNVPPVITSFTCPTDPVAVNTPVTLSGAFTDVGTADTHTASIVWGDGSSSAPTVTQGAGSGSVSGGHIYTAAGIYTPQLTVTDDDGGSDSQTCEYVVVYDPSAGFVTGGGWIWSPAGAYLADPTMTGKATFGFVSKYKKGATTPEGSTEFQFHAAGLNFKSTSYQWLVVAGSKATYKGWGTINGQGNYGFLLAAVDGSPDKFRIKIWDVGSGGVVYDNNLGGGDDADPATALGGGSIVIHTGKK